MKLKRELEAGWFQWVELPLPAVITIQSGINKPRYATLKGIMAAKKKEIATVERASLGVAGRADAAHRAHLRAAENEEDGIHHRLAERGCGEADRKTAPRSAGFSDNELAMKILLITEQRDAKWNKVSFETLAAAQQIAAADERHDFRASSLARVSRRLRRTGRLPARRSASRRARPARAIHAGWLFASRYAR